jgi:hypothetical protein
MHGTVVAVRVEHLLCIVIEEDPEDLVRNSIKFAKGAAAVSIRDCRPGCSVAPLAFLERNTEPISIPLKKVPLRTRHAGSISIRGGRNQAGALERLFLSRGSTKKLLELMSHEL